jgi:hypothetical protein
VVPHINVVVHCVCESLYNAASRESVATAGNVMNKYEVASKRFRKSLVYFTGIAALGKFLSRNLVRHLSDAAGRQCTKK